MRIKKRWIVLVATAAVAVWYFFFRQDSNNRPLSQSDFTFATVEQRTIRSTVSANGNVNPVNVVMVGAQVSGIIDKIYVDFNDRVTQGQLLAEIDKSTIMEELNSNRARVAQAEAAYKLALRNLERAQELFSAGYTAKLELDQAEVEYANSEANLVSARSALNRSEINLGYADIRSPVSGVVISRDVETGQTIAASFTAPTLFRIAEDLSKMQIQTSVSEADIGVIKAGQKVEFTVDAFPLQTFNGKVEQIRLNPTTEQNVVVYNVIIRIDNPDGKLLPGMTAFVEVETRGAKDAPSLPIRAFQFRPDESLKEHMTEQPGRPAVGEAFIWVLDGNSIKPIKIRRGLSDGAFTEVITTELSVGDKVITDHNPGKKSKSANASGSNKPRQGGPGGPGVGGMRM